MRLSEIRAAVIGVGFIGVAHVEALRRLGVDVVGVVGSTPERARAKADAANLPKVYESVEALAADPDIDVVHVASPNYAHADQVRVLIDGGKHVVCEKPLALTSEDTADLVARAAAAGIVNAVCFNLRFYPICHQARVMATSGSIGETRYVTGRYFQDWLLRDTDWNWRLIPEEAGELRAVADIGSHWLDLVQFITGERIVEIMADLHTFVPTRRHPIGSVEAFTDAAHDAELIQETMSSDDAASIMMRFSNGASGLVAVSQVAAGRKNVVEVEIDGSESTLAWASQDPDRLWVGHRGRPNEILERDHALVDKSVAPLLGYPGGHVEGYGDTFRALFSQVYTDIANGHPSDEPAYPTFADGHDVLLVTEAVSRSARDQRWVPVER
jgi:predicted dehydrogenase